MSGAGIELNYYIIIAFWLCVAIAGIIAATTQTAIYYIMEIFTLMIGVCGIWVCSNELIFLLKINFL
jgi:hypothetical protein